MNICAARSCARGWKGCGNMSYDGFVTHSVVDELKNTILGARIDKIHQPESDEILISLRTFEGSFKLLLSASASNARVHFTNVSRENPMIAPMFCMLMRKHLGSGKIIGVEQIGFDRVIKIDVESRNELGDLEVKSLIVEIMGRHSNIILTESSGRVIDSIKRVDFTVSAVRQILPGITYELPPKQDKLEPDEFDVLSYLNMLDRQPGETLLDKLLLSTITGMSPLIAREIAYGFSGHTKITIGEIDTARFAAYLETFLGDIADHKYSPCIAFDNVEKKPLAFSCVKLKQYESSARVKSIGSISEAVDTFYETRARQERMKQRSAAMIKLVHNNIERCQKKIALHRENLKKSQDRDKYKIYGDLLTANLYRIKYGMNEVEVENYYSPNMEKVKIKLKNDISPSQNAQRYYKRYNKAKATETHAVEQIKEAEEELEYLETVLNSLEKAETPADLSEIREELAEQGYIPKSGGKQKKRRVKSAPMKFRSSDGYEILVGRNNKQNDELTIRMAYSTDIWLHTKNIPGSHTLIRTNGTGEASDAAITEAAQLAAYYSKAGNSSHVPVDYTHVKNVKKPNGAKPGFVIYDNYYTIIVDPKPM